MLFRGADGRLYRVSTEGAVAVAGEAQNTRRDHVAGRRTDDAGASAELYSTSAELYSATL